jgi:ribosome-binding factor A
MADYKRADRVAGELQRALAEVLLQGLNDPRVTPITVIGVRLSDDLRIAHVTYAPLGGGGDADSLQKGLTAASGYLRREVGRRLSLRFQPRLVFHLDAHIDDNVRMVRFLQELVEEDADRDAADEDAP